MAPRRLVLKRIADKQNQVESALLVWVPTWTRDRALAALRYLVRKAKEAQP